MGNSYDLFKQSPEGNPIFVETIIGLVNLRKRLMKLSSIKPGRYLVYDPTEARFVEPFERSA